MKKRRKKEGKRKIYLLDGPKERKEKGKEKRRQLFFHLF